MGSAIGEHLNKSWYSLTVQYAQESWDRAALVSLSDETRLVRICIFTRCQDERSLPSVFLDVFGYKIYKLFFHRHIFSKNRLEICSLVSIRDKATAIVKIITVLSSAPFTLREKPVLYDFEG